MFGAAEDRLAASSTAMMLAKMPASSRPMRFIRAVAMPASRAASSASPVATICAPVFVHLTRPQAKSVAPAIQSTRLGMPKV
ncbi:hypothetical protein BTHI11S_04470 [Bosea thiooxidans]